MVINKDISRLKICIDVKLIGSSSIKLIPITIDYKIHSFYNSVLFVCKDGFVFEKRPDDITYLFNRLIIPPYINNSKIIYNGFTFVDDQTRYNALKRLANNLVEFTGSGFFGINPYSRLLTHSNFWFVY